MATHRSDIERGTVVTIQAGDGTEPAEGTCLDCPQFTPDPHTGLTQGEEIVHRALMSARLAWLQLDRQHPDEDREFTDAVHKIQDLLAVRIVRREYPDFWPTHEF